MRHQSDPRVLNERTLEKDHKRLAALLRPGVSVLDVGCGTGAITRGIRAVTGDATGIDRDASLVPAEDGFVVSDIFDYAPGRQFDVVTAARVLQWIASPERALAKMVELTRPGGRVVVLDYAHERNEWDPEAPPSFQHFWRAFLRWREANGWDNLLADRLEGMFAAAGLREVAVTDDDEVASGALWPHVMESLGPVVVRDGFLTDLKLLAACEGLAAYGGVQRLALRTAIGVRA
ncbi:MAG: methyltransferase domain-containing protein [Acidobacteria bacterium]|nr:methyltransferase domain-containing protein [Acidobacteriota bacterium]